MGRRMGNRDIKNSIKKAMERDRDTKTFHFQEEYDNEKRNENIEESRDYELHEDARDTAKEDQIKPGTDDRAARKRRDRPLKLLGLFCAAAFVLMLVFSSTPSVNTTDAAKNALRDKVSTSLSAGTILFGKDENIGAQDYTITHSSDKEETRIWVWDYAAQDGDYVQVLVDGVPLGDAFMIKNKPREITVPSTGNIQIKGIRDGGGGITYAVRYELNGTNYFNTAPEGEFNTYTLIRQ